MCDPNQLESALLNIAINARDAMPEGGTLTITTVDRHLTERDVADQDGVMAGDYVEMIVTDTGSGMPDDILARAFEPFFTTKPLGQGTGLGLSQIYGFVQQSGGFVRLESKPGSGTTVRLLLPRHAPTDVSQDSGAKAGASATAVCPSAATPPLARGTVLVVDDERDVRDLITEALKDLGCQVRQAVDGPAGLRIVLSGDPIDMLITDVGLPGLNGRQLAEAARQTRAALPVLLITGYAGRALGDSDLPPGIEVIRKPFALETLVERVRKLLETSPAC